MKRCKKFASVLLAMVMMLALSVTAFGANTAAGETYTVYKIFDATISGDNASYSIASDSEWLSVVQDYATADNGLTLTLSADGTKYVVTVNSEVFTEAKAAEFAAYLADNTTGKTAAKTKTGTKDGVTVTGLTDGYYLITSSLGSVCQLATGGEIIINEKNTVPDVEKIINNEDAYAQIGKVIPFTITVKDGTGTNKEITLHDQMSEALTLNTDSIKITVNDQDVNPSNYDLKTGDAADPDTFSIVFHADYVASLDEGAEIVVTYTATLNEKAVTVDKITNKASIDYSNQGNTDESVVEIKTNSFEVRKYAADDTEKKNLAGAVFQLKQGDTVISLIKVDDNTYRVAMPNEEGAVDSFTTVGTGNIVIRGVDSDLAYTLVETTAPDGYNLLTAPENVTVNADNSTVTEIANQAGSTLPTTGGMGTTLLYTVGIILVLGAGVTLVVRRRMNAAK